MSRAGWWAGIIIATFFGLAVAQTSLAATFGGTVKAVVGLAKALDGEAAQARAEAEALEKEVRGLTQQHRLNQKSLQRTGTVEPSTFQVFEPNYVSADGETVAASLPLPAPEENYLLTATMTVRDEAGDDVADPFVNCQLRIDGANPPALRGQSATGVPTVPGASEDGGSSNLVMTGILTRSDAAAGPVTVHCLAPSAPTQVGDVSLRAVEVGEAEIDRGPAFELPSSGASTAG